MVHAQGSLWGAGEAELFYQRWWPEERPRAMLAIVHGIGEHSGRYTNVAESLTARGIGVYGLDQRGHGRSAGHRGHIGSWSEYTDDLQAFVGTIRSQEPRLPLFVMGHSLGALIVADAFRQEIDQVSGVVLSGIPIEPAGARKPHLVAIARLLSNVWPTFTLSLGLDRAALSRDPAIASEYRSDPLVHGMATARWGTETLAAIERVKSHAAELRVPVLFLHGERDRLNLAEGCRQFCDAVGSLDRTLKIYPGGYHEPHNDLDREQVMCDLVAWIDEHLQGTSSVGP